MPGIKEAKCVLVVGATAGIGRALALAIHDLPSQPTVIVSGRRQERIDELCKKSDRIQGLRVDLLDGRDALEAYARDAIAKYPGLDAVILCSGIQHQFDFRDPEKIDLDLFEAELTTNYTSLVTLTKLFMPHFLERSRNGLPSFVIPVNSALAITPVSTVPGYCATKAALHSFAMTLHVRLKDTNVHVMEVIPPLTESELHDHQGPTDRYKQFWLPLDKFTEDAMEGLCRGDVQIAVASAKHRWEKYEKQRFEDIVAAAW